MYGMYRYTIITPIRNEEKYIEKTMHSMINQTIKPIQWIIVDDGSTDDTYNIVAEYAKKYKWITAFRKNTPPSETTETGSIPKAFNFGLKFVKLKNYDFIVKLDGDLSFESDYFERIFKEFEKNPELGIASGGCYEYDKNGNLQLEKVPKFHTRGASKVYRKECFEDIGGIIPHLGWDTVDEIKAWMRGWKTRNFSEIKMIHHKKTGSRGSILRGKIRLGKVGYIVGYNPLFMYLRFLRNIPKSPLIIGSIAMFIGYVKGWLNEDKVKDKRLIHFIWKEQLKKITGAKSIWE